jgi:hypothetical protein
MRTNAYLTGFHDSISHLRALHLGLEDDISPRPQLQEALRVVFPALLVSSAAETPDISWDTSMLLAPDGVASIASVMEYLMPIIECPGRGPGVKTFSFEPKGLHT